MRTPALTLAILVGAAAALPAASYSAQAPPAPAAAPAASPTPAATPTPTPRPYEEVIKYWKSKLFTEDFIRQRIQESQVDYDLGVEETIRLREEGVPEGLINAMIQKKTGTAPKAAPPAPAGAPGGPAPAAGAIPAAPAAVGTAASPAAVAPVTAASPAAAPSLAAQANRKWEGLSRRNSGVVLFKSRWDVGALEFKEETLRWIDAKDTGKNLMIPSRQITEQFLTCLKKSGGNECFEWGFKTKDQEFRFRDVSWQQGENTKAQELFEFMKAIYPNLISAQVPVDSK